MSIPSLSSHLIASARCYRHDYLVMDRRSTATLICDGAGRSCFHTQASLSRSVIGTPAVTYGLLAAWAAHGLEEALAFGPWARHPLPRLRERYPGIPGRVWRTVESVDERKFAVAVALVGAVMAAAARRMTGTRSRPRRGPRPRTRRRRKAARGSPLLVTLRYSAPVRTRRQGQLVLHDPSPAAAPQPERPLRPGRHRERPRPSPAPAGGRAARAAQGVVARPVPQRRR